MSNADPPSVEHLVATALTGAGDAAGLARAGEQARTTRDRQLVAIAIAYLRGEHDRVNGLAREHLVDHPDSVLVAAIAATANMARRSPRPASPHPVSPHPVSPRPASPHPVSPRPEGNPS